VRDLNRLYRARDELHALDCDGAGFSWIDCNDCDTSVLSYIRRGSDSSRFLVVVCNLTPVVRSNYGVGVPRSGSYREVLNTDSAHYGGSNVGNRGAITADGPPAHGHTQSLVMILPPLATLILEPA
jgi:1,4-alpha-glucan branching enzyme